VRKRSKIRLWQNLYFFNVSIFFIPHLILRNIKCMANWKQVHFWAFCPVNRNKSFFQHFFCIFLHLQGTYSYAEKIKKSKSFLLFSKWIEKKVRYAHPRAWTIFFKD
jgi:hypothetical protein